jgi:sugar lactone lactonase YvrE
VYGHPFFPNGSSAAGPNHIGFLGTGAAYITLGLGGNETFQGALGAGAPFFGTVIQMATSGRWKVVADVLAHEADENPGGGEIDSNAYGMLAEPGVRYVTDAGGNSLLAVYGNGRIETVAIFPSRDTGRTTDAVPTSVVRGPDEAFYVGELTGVPFAPGAARVYRVVPGHAPEIFLEGFKTIMDLAFDPQGNLYVVENATGGTANPQTWFLPNSGQVTRVAPDGTRTVVASGLNRPTAIVVGPDGELYVTNNGVLAGVGEVLRIDID